MKAMLLSWGLKIKQRPIVAVVVVTAFVVGIVFIIAVYNYGWDWTGFNGGYSQVTIHMPTKDIVVPPARTLWDWLQLLIIPIILAIGGFWLNQLQKRREEKAAEQRVEAERKAAEQRAQLEREAAEKRAQTEREIAQDNQREDALQSYIDKMSELLLKENLRNSKDGDEVRTIARARTLTVLPRLDSNRKRIVFNFLLESSLIGNNNAVVDLRNADFSDTYIGLADLTGANLEFVNFTRAVLFATKLTGANLMGANLTEADLEEADLKGAILYYANLDGADFTRADLEAAKVNDKQLDQIRSLEGAIMPDGSKHP